MRLWLSILLLATACTACEDAPSPPVSAASGAPSATASTTASASSDTSADRARLEFSVANKTVRSLSRRQLTDAIESETFTAFDPYYGKKKTYRALPIEAVLEQGLGDQDLDLAKQHFVLKARDGYTVPIEGAQLLGGGAYLAIEDLDQEGWLPIGPQQADPGPYYLVWRGEDQQDLEVHPRPWQLASIAVARFEDSFPKTVPQGQPEDSAAMRGFAIFRQQCLRCHAINRQGGRVGPDLNVPQSIVEYRPEKQIRAYIENPQTFRYGNMPSNPHLKDSDLDDLLAYFRAMSKQKHDPGAGDAPPSH